jgi:hypothetical protein
MGVESAADRASFMALAGFGTRVTYTPLSGSPASFNAIFDNAYLAVEGGGEASVASLQPVLICRDDDLAALAAGRGVYGDSVVIAGTTYKVVDLQPDGTGMTSIVLEKH